MFCRVLDPLVYPKSNLGRLCEDNNFDDGLFDKRVERPCGPSITLETVIYMALHVGVKDISKQTMTNRSTCPKAQSCSCFVIEHIQKPMCVSMVLKYI